MDLQTKINQLPSTPGVYLMKDSLDHTIYVGKSKHLKQRVQSYFRSSSSSSPKVRKLVSNIRDVDFIETDTEFEAFMLEWQLIQEIKPSYNRQMKTPLAFTYLIIQEIHGIYQINISTQPLRQEGAHFWSVYQ